MDLEHIFIYFAVALNKFVEQADTYGEDSVESDIVKDYCKASPECQEVFQILEHGKRTSSEVRIYVLPIVLYIYLQFLLAHLCGELMPYPWRCPSSVVRRGSSVSTITTRNN